MSQKDVVDTLERVVKVVSEIDTHGLKLVKSAHIEKSNGLYKIIHYGTVIFSYDPKTQDATARKNLSRTSDRQIRAAISFFSPVNVNYIEPKNKWEYSR